MGLPIIFAVEDEADVPSDLERDLAKRYGADYQVIVSDSPEHGLDGNVRVKRRRRSVSFRDTASA